MKIAVLLLLGVFVAIIALSSAKKHEDHYSHRESGSEGGGHESDGDHYSNHKGGSKSGKSSRHEEETGWYGSDGSDLHRTDDLEKGGKKHKHYHADKHESYHDDHGGSGHGAKFEEGSKKHKGNANKGFREQFHKDELKKHDSFFSKGEKSGNYNLFGNKGAKYGSQSGSKKSGRNLKNLQSGEKYGKGGKKAGGHKKSDRRGYKGSKSSHSSYAHGDSYGRKGGKKGGKHYKYHH